MATNGATCSNKGPLNESDDVTLRNNDDQTELTSHQILEVIEEENLENLKKEEENENSENFDTDPIEESRRIRKLTEKGEEEKIRRLKQQRTNALAAVSRKRTDINNLMIDRRNLDVIKTELNKLDSLCQQFYDAHNLYREELSTPEEKENAYRYFDDKENDMFKYRKEVTNWILECEARISEHLDRLSEKRSSRSRSSRTSRSSSVHSARLKEKAKIAELMAERAMLKQKLKLKAAEEQLQIELKIAKAKARETAFAEMDGSLKDSAGEDEYRLLPSSLQSHETPLASHTLPTLTKPKFKTETTDHPDLNPNAREFLLPPEIKTDENFKPQTNDEEILKEIFKMQQDQIQRMISSQHELATAITLPQPQVPRFKGDPMEYKTFVMAFETRIESKVISSADRLYYLDQHLEGEPKELISGCLHIEANDGYQEARRLLEREYGDPYKVSIAYMQKLTNWPNLKYDDGPALKRLSIFLNKCSTAMKSLAHLAVLNHPTNMQAVVQKLPTFLQAKWRENVVRAKRKDGSVVGFYELMEFVEYAADTANDPIYGKEALIKIKPRTNATTEDKKLPQPKLRVDSFATNPEPLKSPPSHGTGCSGQHGSTCRCPLCGKSHDLEDCEAYKKKSVEERRSFVAQKSLCFACYGENHKSRSCRKKRECKKCKKPHPTLLHVDGFNLNKENGSLNKDSLSKEKTPKVNNALVSIPPKPIYKGDILLQTILPVIVTQKGTGKLVKTYAFYDNGSAGCFLTERLKTRLEATSTSTTLQLGTMHGRTLVDSSIVKDLIVTDLNGENPVQLPTAFTREEIPADQEQIPTPEIVNRIEHFKNIASKIPAYDPELEIGLLIGSNCPNALVPLNVVPNEGDGPYAVRFRHGWTVSGPLHVATESATNEATVNRITVREVETIKEIITPKSLLNMLELDFNEKASTNLPEELGHSQEDRRFLTKVSNSIRLTSGHYEIPLPFRQSEVSLPNNRDQAVKRALWQRKKMSQNDKYRNDYIAFINDMIERGYAEKVPEESLEASPGTVWYIPHHGVYHPKKPEKIRVVFDCSAKFAGTSLNNQLLQGPDLTNSLVGVLTRFREELVAFMGDVEAMFYQVLIPENQLNFLRFLWWPGGDLNADLVEYRMVVHPFGAVSSPSCANFALRTTANYNEPEFGKAVAETMRRNFYVDDCLKSVPTILEAKEQINGLRQACRKGGFRLTKFVCNQREVLESIPEEERSKDVKTLDLSYDDLPIERALGVQWCVESDTFGFRIIIKDKPLTRRGILSIVSSIYDPLGFVAPFTLIAKKLLQDMCREEKLGWDDEPPDCYLKRWEKWRSELPLLERLTIPRCVKPTDFREVKSKQLHIFSDASTMGYGAAVYQRLRDNEGRIHCSFLMGKARLAPIKPVTIPRLELTAATVSIRLGEMMKKELDDTPETLIYHTDSETVLRYIGNEQKRFQIFVANRVQLIRNFSDPRQWRYVDTKENPADDASRGLDAKTLTVHQRWLKGPEFLWQPEETWPTQPQSFGDISNEDPEVKKQVKAFATTIADLAATATVLKLLQHFSDWYRLKKAVAVYLRIKTILNERRLRRTNNKPIKLKEERMTLTVHELEVAEMEIIRFVQSQNFKHELQTLQLLSKGKYEEEQLSPKKNKVNVGKTSSVYRLDPFLDKGLLRVGGRLNNADLPSESKHPIILPRKSNATTLIIRNAHEQLGHAGRGHVLARLREKYWIVGANSAVRQIISACVLCRRNRAPPQEQKMADLPPDRLTPAPPFTYIGVDLFGPFATKEGRKERKRYGVLFTCLVSRAVHIEITNSLETDCFINALRRFIARRGPVREIRCDNGTNFVGAKKELKNAVNEMDQNEITEKLRQLQIDWKFNPPAASHMGGVWERQIRTVRRILCSLLHEHGGRLDDESLQTLMCEAESIINSRPLTAISSDIKDPIPLSPGQILTMKTSVVLPPPGNFQRNDVYMRRRWRRVQHLCNLFWSRWKKEYLPTLQERPKWNQEKRNLKIDDIVLVKDDNAPRNVWPMGVVTKVEADSKGLVRSVLLRTQSTELRRPVNKLVLLLAVEERMNTDDD